MNFHVFVFIATIVFYIIMKMYKKTIEKQTNKTKKSSNLMYILFVPFLLYLTHFMFLTPHKDQLYHQKNYSDDLLTEPYPVS